MDHNGEPVLAAGGKTCSVYLYKPSLAPLSPQPDVSPSSCCAVLVCWNRYLLQWRLLILQKLSNFGGPIHTVQFHPAHVEYVFVASGDQSIKVIHVPTRELVAIFGGKGGHLNEVLTLVNVSPTHLAIACLTLVFLPIHLGYSSIGEIYGDRWHG